MTIDVTFRPVWYSVNFSAVCIAVCSSCMSCSLVPFAFVGVGLGYSILNSLIGIYYNVIIALAFYYLFGSLTASLPWASCDNDWNTPTCGDPVWFNTSGRLLHQLLQALL